MAQKEDKDDTHADTCHFNFQCALFCAQVLFSFTMLLFGMCMIAFKNGQLEVYLPLLSTTAAVWLPNPVPPQFKKKGIVT